MGLLVGERGRWSTDWLKEDSVVRWVRGGETIYRMVEPASYGEVGEGRWEVVGRLVEEVSKGEVGKCEGDG